MAAQGHPDFRALGRFEADRVRRLARQQPRHSPAFFRLYDIGFVAAHDRGAGIDDRFKQIGRRPNGADFAQFRADAAAFAVNRVTSETGGACIQKDQATPCPRRLRSRDFEAP